METLHNVGKCKTKPHHREQWWEIFKIANERLMTLVQSHTYGVYTTKLQNERHTKIPNVHLNVFDSSGGDKQSDVQQQTLKMMEGKLYIHT